MINGLLFTAALHCGRAGVGVSAVGCFNSLEGHPPYALRPLGLVGDRTHGSDVRSSLLQTVVALQRAVGVPCPDDANRTRILQRSVRVTLVERVAVPQSPGCVCLPSCEWCRVWVAVF